MPHARAVFDAEILAESPGLCILSLAGKDPLALFSPEAGVHRWQRVPHTEKRGRRQSSTITVAVLPVPQTIAVSFRECDLDEKTTRGSGPGGQHRNKVATAVVLRHIPTGIVVRAESERSLQQNKLNARKLLAAKVEERTRIATERAYNGARTTQIGQSGRAEKIRTVMEQNGVVVNHRTGRRCSVKDYYKGELARIQ